MIPVEQLLEQDSLSRYQLTRLLNAVECQDCIAPSEAMRSRYHEGFRKEFLQQPGKDFGDISYLSGTHQGINYYYCVAKVGAEDTMRGYPQATSPICGGKFCGERKVNKAEFFQTLTNLLTDKVKGHYQAPWKAIKTWLKKQKKQSYQYRVFTTDELALLQKKENQTQQIRSRLEFTTYLKYCMFNPSLCGFQIFDHLKSGVWPLAEVNILIKEGIMTAEAVEELAKPITPKEALDQLNLLYDLHTQCDFNLDYDCDGIPNHQDNCPYVYNPSQNDLDGYGIGDVCDDDIDADGLKNPVGLVDDTGNINYALLKTQPSQDPTPLGEVHEEDYYTIKISSLPQTLPAEVRFEIASKNAPLAVEWDFGDLTQAKGKKVAHYYKTPGLKTVLAKVTSKKNQTFLLRQQLNIGEESEQMVSLAMKLLELNAQQKKARIQPEIQGRFEYFEWSNTATQQKGKLTSLAAFDIPLVEGKTNTLYLKGYAQGKMLALASINILEEKGNFFTMSLETRPLLKLLGKDVTMSLKLHQLSLANIEHIKWDFGDGENALDRKLLQQHHYDKAGLKLISQKILLKNGKELLIRTSVSIQDPERLGNQAFTSLLGGETLSLQPLGFDHPHTFSTRINGQPLPHASENAFQPLNLKAWQGLLRIEQTLSPAKGLLLSNQSFFLRPRKGLQSGGQLANPDQLFAGLKCDADQDGIPDLYDDDLDGDGVKNLLGLIRYERADCKLIPGENVDEQRYTQHFGVCSLDNCPLVSNADQSDLNANGKGDSCEKEEEQPKSECGNGKIDSGENCKTCPQDFGPCPDKQEPFCGNGKKEEGEDCKTCPQDIGSCSDEQKPFCGNGKKEA